MPETTNEVTITVDGVQIRVPKGTNVIEAAAKVGIEIPHYCYHPNLSIAGNCRMCQVQVEGAPKLAIACNLGATEGLVVRTHKTSKEVADAQRATLEFLLINHPLDCTVCDQAGHCKLQDYYYTYNAKPSRFVEEKVHKVKAEPFGPEVVYDGERCILCTRCVRFCDEVPGTGELGLYNRGDQAVIGVNPGHELTNPLSGTVVDLCPVGALTHRRWRFNTRIWYTHSADSICAGCSTGCNVKGYVRDAQIVQVKARRNEKVNQEWLCDEGRYGFNRLQPESRLAAPQITSSDGASRAVGVEEACKAAIKLGEAAAADDGTAAIFLSPSLTLEEIWLAIEFAKRVMKVSPGSGQIAMQLRTRTLTDVEKVLISPDYAANGRAAGIFGLGNTGADWRESLQSGYDALLRRVRGGPLRRILLVGDGAILAQDADSALRSAIAKAELSVSLSPRGLTEVQLNGSGAHQPTGKNPLEGVAFPCTVMLPGRTVHEKNGVLVNQQLRFQRIAQLLQPPLNSQPEWALLQRMSKAIGKPLLPDSVIDDRALFREMVAQTPAFSGLSLTKIGVAGITLEELRTAGAAGDDAATAGAAA